MKDEKRNKIAVAITVNMVLLVFILVAIIIAQIVQISVLSASRSYRRLMLFYRLKRKTLKR